MGRRRGNRSPRRRPRRPPCPSGVHPARARLQCTPRARDLAGLFRRRRHRSSFRPGWHRRRVRHPSGARGGRVARHARRLAPRVVMTRTGGLLSLA